MLYSFVVNSCRLGRNLLNMAASKPCEDCRMKCGKGRIDEHALRRMEDAFQTLEQSNSKSMLKRHLTRAVFDKLKDVQTPMGSTLMDCIQSGVHNLDSSIGVYAADSDCYLVFHELFNPIIDEYHGFRKSQVHPKPEWGNSEALPVVDPHRKYVLSTRIRCARSVEGFPFNPTMTEQQYKDLEKKCEMAVNGLQGELRGTYYPLKLMSKTEQDKLIEDHYLFKEGDRFLQAANAARYWPTGRGIFYNPQKTFLVWIGEEDHMRLISMQNGGDVKEVFKRLKSAVGELEKVLKFTRNERLGYLSFCPTNLGTTIRASVHIKLPKLASDLQQLEKVASKHNLQVRGTSGEHSESQEGVYDISNKRRLGLTEFEAIKEMADGIVAMIKLEESL